MREHLQKKVQQRRQQRQQEQTPRGATATPGRTPQQRGIPSSFLTPPSSSRRDSLPSLSASASRSSCLIREALGEIEKLKELKSGPATPRSTPTRPRTDDEGRRKRKKTTLFDDGRRDDYNLRERHRKKSKDDDDGDDRPKKHAKRKTKWQ